MLLTAEQSILSRSTLLRSGINLMLVADIFQVKPPLKPAPDLKHELLTLDGGQVLLEKDVAITMRDGVRLYADIYRPVDSIEKTTPSIVLFAPFGKHGAVPREKFTNMGVDFSKLSKYTHWELPDPLVWCADYQYSLVSVDPRGTWWSEGERAHFFSPEEGRDGYDVVEWIAKQDWLVSKDFRFVMLIY
jgi:predicted acyl esterase